jgi:hypothetical protein
MMNSIAQVFKASVIALSHRSPSSILASDETNTSIRPRNSFSIKDLNEPAIYFSASICEMKIIGFAFIDSALSLARANSQTRQARFP